MHEQTEGMTSYLKIRARRVYVDHVAKDLKTLRVIGKFFKHNRRHLAPFVALCTGLAQRKVDLIQTL